MSHHAYDTNMAPQLLTDRYSKHAAIKGMVLNYEFTPGIRELLLEIFCDLLPHVFADHGEMIDWFQLTFPDTSQMYYTTHGIMHHVMEHMPMFTCCDREAPYVLYDPMDKHMFGTRKYDLPVKGPLDLSMFFKMDANVFTERVRMRAHDSTQIKEFFTSFCQEMGMDDEHNRNAFWKVVYMCEYKTTAQ
jgi:hypothetical protein